MLRAERPGAARPRARRAARGATGRVDAALRSALPGLVAEGLTPGARVLVGVSGGQDSLCLAHALWRLRDEHRWSLHVVHVDHGMRPEAGDEAAALVGTCQRWGLPVTVVRADVPGYRARERLNVQAAARFARYQAFAAASERLGAAAVAVAHTADDVAETLLLHLLRGAGLDGLASMPLVQRLPPGALGPPAGATAPPAVRVARPLLPVARVDTAAYCAEQGLTPLAEAPGPYQRDRVRHELLPLLERYNPAVRRALANTASALAEERVALDAAAAALAARFQPDSDRLTLPLDEWQALPVAMRKRLLRHAAVALAGADAELGRAHLAAALRLASAQAGRAIDLPGGLQLAREPGALALSRRLAAAPPPPPGLWPLAVPGAVRIPGVGVVRAELAGGPPVDLAVAPPTECWLDAGAVGGALSVRWRQRGDRFQPLGMAADKRLQDFLVDARVPRADRDRVPLVVAGTRIAWVVGHRIADWARVRPASARLLHLSFEPAPVDETPQ